MAISVVKVHITMFLGAVLLIFNILCTVVVNWTRKTLVYLHGNELLD